MENSLTTDSVDIIKCGLFYGDSDSTFASSIPYMVCLFWEPRKGKMFFFSRFVMVLPLACKAIRILNLLYGPSKNTGHWL